MAGLKYAPRGGGDFFLAPVGMLGTQPRLLVIPCRAVERHRDLEPTAGCHPPNDVVLSALGFCDVRGLWHFFQASAFKQKIATGVKGMILPLNFRGVFTEGNEEREEWRLYRREGYGGVLGIRYSWLPVCRCDGTAAFKQRIQSPQKTRN
jgi:hypothetical protein